MDWRLRDIDRIALLVAVHEPVVVEVRKGESHDAAMVRAYSKALGKLEGKVASMLSNLERIEAEDMEPVEAGDSKREIF